MASKYQALFWSLRIQQWTRQETSVPLQNLVLERSRQWTKLSDNGLEKDTAGRRGRVYMCRRRGYNFKQCCSRRPSWKEGDEGANMQRFLGGDYRQRITNVLVLCCPGPVWPMWFKILNPGHLGGSVVEHLPLAQGVIPESWDWVLHQAPPREPASPSAYSLMNK